ncbi:MAG: 23S rRNA (uracil(1939)-C(5))-methyltransferase RlmD [Planctomycetota bacterium]
MRQSHPAARRPSTPECRHFGSCGSCSSLSTPIAEQVEEKAADVESLIGPFLGGRRLEWTIPRATPLHFRQKLLYPVVADSRGLPILGMFRRESRELVRIRECRTMDPRLVSIGSAAERILRGLRLDPLDPSTGKGRLIAFQARVFSSTGEAILGVVTAAGLFPEGAELAARLEEAAASEGLRPVGVVRGITKRKDGFLLGEQFVPLAGRDWAEDRADGLRFRVGLGSFYQAHRDAASVLYRPALRLCGPLSGLCVVDAYGGVGAFGLRCAKQGASRVEIIEDGASSCRDAEHNARANGLPQVRVERARFAQSAFDPGPDLMVLDPPRSGLGPDGVRRALEARPRRLLLVSCSAESMARDLEGLWSGGYRVVRARLCDMFPHTRHAEVVAVMERRGS